MKRSIVSYLSAAAVSCSAAWAYADDELVIQVNDASGEVTTLAAKVDGGDSQPISGNGTVSFDLSAGGHSVQLLRNGEVVHSFRFDSANGQLTDINIALASGAKPKVAIESYSKNETAGQKLKAAKGGLQGVVSSNGQAVVGAMVTVVGEKYSATTNAYGEYELQLPRGIYELEISHPDLGSQHVKDYRVVANVTKGSDFRLRGSDKAIEEVVVLAKVNVSAFEDSERYSSNVVDTMGMEQLARFGDSDVAASVVRVPSVTVQDSRFVFIRGLGGRYITTTLNGATLPSTDPSKRTVPLDLFPSNIVEQLSVRKTFVASMPGESTGGNLVINTRSLSEEDSGKLSFTMGYVDGLTGKSAYVDPHSGDYDALGWDDGTRDAPGMVVGIADALRYSEFLNQEAKNNLGRIAGLELLDNWDLAKDTANPDVSLSINYGDIYYIDSADAELSAFAALNYKNEWKKKDKGVRRTYGGGDSSEVEDNFSFEEFSNDIDVSGLVSLGLNIGESTYQSNTIVSRVTEESVRLTEGYDSDSLQETIRWSIEWQEREFLSQQFRGQHVFGDNEQLSNEWQVTFSRATRDAPDRREVRFDLEGTDNVYNLQVPNLTRRYDELTDDNIDISSKFDLLIESVGDIESTVSAGFQVITRERESESNTYGFTGGQTAIDDNAPNLQVSDVINAGNVTGDTSTGYTFQDKTVASDSYDAEMDLNSLFVSYDALINSEYQVVLGARYEDYEQQTETYALEGDQAQVESLLEDDVILPSLAFNWFFEEDQQLRIAISETVSRPDFKETANATFYDNEFDFRVRGNPNLEVSKVTNFDARWEKYWSDDESISLALFYKDLSDPIERIVLPASGTAGNSRTFQNSDSAEIYGIEFDGRKVFPLDKSYVQSLFVSVNASWIDSEVELGSGETRELQGQPEYTFNLVVGYDDIEKGHELTLLANQNGQTIVDVGISGLPDIVEEPRFDLNLNYKYQFSDDLSFKAKLKNLLNSEVEFTQGGKVFQRYERGVQVQAGFDWNF
ncbi:TonB-dependent receptor [Dasania sp. GY-MA-18]|uniref:TonB-dependent receptor n=1 Tax=Dasania phycosphaerae TaxID=2950436 RepID=A0A9J6RLX4_9GAMM|nr:MULTISPECIES: TonB-dependent receptor [Dasania]MCR8922560.1 TonB-dependent receptor [Dasania sp. GY-MA-18]MCZ0864989.1 TonB-dependent receptor [Dasania phycosphaerae]MCZ0868716.1 TonB-dependent receptor [Dasania phycosphaerae]